VEKKEVVPRGQVVGISSLKNLILPNICITLFGSQARLMHLCHLISSPIIFKYSNYYYSWFISEETEAQGDCFDKTTMLERKSGDLN
jgi:hypothetical protein